MTEHTDDTTSFFRDEELKRILNVKGIRVTKQRLKILRELARRTYPASHHELSEHLAGASLDRATIYRNLVSLTEAGVLIRTQLGDNVRRFEFPRTPSSEHGLHPHFVCMACGAVACLAENAVSLRGDVTRNEVFEVQLRGRCGACVRT